MRRLLDWLAPRLADSILGDLEEVRRRRAGRSSIRARLWFVAAAAGIVARLLAGHLGRGVRETGAGLGTLFRPGAGLELRQALRSLRRAAWYSITVLAVVALTTALSGTVFAVVDGVLFKALPYSEPDRLATASGRRADGRSGVPLTFDEIDAWRRALPGVPTAGYQHAHDAGTLGDGVTYAATRVDRYFFDVLGQEPARGGFAPWHFEAGGEAVVIVSDRVWRQKLGARRDVIGETLPVAAAVDNIGRPVARPVIVGILPADFVFPSGETIDLLYPAALTQADRARRNESAAVALIRRPHGVAAETLQARIDAATRDVQESAPAGQSAIAGARIQPLDDLGRPYQRSFRSLAGVSGTLILLGCAAIATLAASRSRQLERQSSVRRSLGATSWDLFRSSLIESACLTGAGAACGAALAPAALSATMALLPADGPFVKAPVLDLRVWMVVAAIALGTAVVAAAASRRPGDGAPMAAASAGSTRRVRRRGRMLIALQTALAFVLTLGGMLGIGSLLRAWWTDTGYDPARLAIVEVYARARDFREAAGSLQRALAAVQDLPGVSAGTFGGRLLAGGRTIATVRREAGGEALEFALIDTAGELFELLDLSPLRGRLPSADEYRRGDPVVVLSAPAADALWPDGSALGRTVHLSQSAATVIGIVPERRLSSVAGRFDRTGQIYMPGLNRRTTTYVLSSEGSVRPALEAARGVIESTGDLDVVRAVTMREAFAHSLRDHRLAAWLYGGFAVSSLAIVATAILGLVAMTTSLRVRELGIRSALGARRDGLVAMLLREQCATVFTGLAIGLAVAYWSLGLLRGAVNGLAPTDYRLWSIAAATILVTALAGVLVPALRATRVDPVVALRVD